MTLLTSLVQRTPITNFKLNSFQHNSKLYKLFFTKSITTNVNSFDNIKMTMDPLGQYCSGDPC